MRSPRLLSFQTKKRLFPVLFFQICQMEPRGAEIAKGMPGKLEVKLNRLQTCRSHPVESESGVFVCFSVRQLIIFFFFFFHFLDLLFKKFF